MPAYWEVGVKRFLPGKSFFMRWESVGDKIVSPFQTFAALEAAGGFLLVAMTIVAVVWANSSSSNLYHAFTHLELGVIVGRASFVRDVHFLINEGLMSIFFLVVGLEIKRELLVGELNTPRKAALPALAAIGGVVVPALIYYGLNMGTPAARGWGIPMATDIAFVVSALTVLRSRVPASLAVFLVSLAIVDDLTAVVVIASFYSTEISIPMMGLAGIGLVMLAGINILGFRNPIPYVIIGLAVWFFVYFSGVHATVAGVLIALTVPARSRTDEFAFAENMQKVFGKFKPEGDRGFIEHLDEDKQAVIRSMERLVVSLEPPLQRLEYVLHPWVVFLILPVFALGNAGVRIEWGSLWSALSSSQGLGIILGLFVGKQVGILGAAWLAVKAGRADIPEDMTFKHVYGGSLLCGIGFTMSLFIATLSLDDPILIDGAKIAVLTGSLLSGAAGTAVLSRCRNSADGESPQR